MAMIEETIKKFFSDGEAEQRNNMAFRYIAKMEYDTMLSRGSPLVL